MPVNTGVKSKNEYELQLLEYDGVPIFFESDRSMKTDVVTCHLSKSDLELSLERVISSYIPIKYVHLAEGVNHLTTSTSANARASLNEPISQLFTGDSKAVVLYLHMGTLFDRNQFIKQRRNIKAYMDQFKATLDKPAFWRGNDGLIAKDLMRQIENEYSTTSPNLAMVNYLFNQLNEILKKADDEEYSPQLSARGYIGIGLAFILIGLLIYALWNITHFVIFKS